jgi:hypothetical protein
MMPMEFFIGSQTEQAHIEVFPFEGQWILHYSGPDVWEERYSSASAAMLRVAVLIRCHEEVSSGFFNYADRFALVAETFLEQEVCG